ncbi:MAG: TPM domain-containing protein [Pyrinomonadaceae bacterium]
MELSPANASKAPLIAEGVSDPPVNTNSNPNDGSVFGRRTDFVNDFANVLDDNEEAELEQILSNFKERHKIDFVVLTVNTTAGESASDYSLKVANDWGIAADNKGRTGIFMLIAVDDRSWHVQISRTLEKVLSNSEVNEIGAMMPPYFKEQKYSEGITKCVGKFIEVVKKKGEAMEHPVQPE